MIIDCESIDMETNARYLSFNDKILQILNSYAEMGSCVEW